MNSSQEASFKHLILRHRSVAVLIRRGHLEDARLLLASLVEDLGMLEFHLAGEKLFASLESLEPQLGQSIPPGSLDPEFVRVLSRTNAQCLSRLRTLHKTISSSPASFKSLRSPLLISILLGCLGLIIWFGMHQVQVKKMESAHRDVAFLAQIAHIAKMKTGKTLIEITHNSCSDCVCKPGEDLRGASLENSCQTNWIKALAAIWQAASGQDPYDIRGRILLELRLLRDPWGSPYVLNENEGETPGQCEADVIRSAGPDGILGTPDDIKVRVPTLCTPEK